MNLSHAHPTLPTLDETDFVEVLFPGLDRPGLLHVPTMRVVPPLSGGDDGDDEDGDDDKGDKGDDEDTDDEDDKDEDEDDDLAAARKAAAAANRELRKLKADAAREATKAKAKAGEWEALYNEEKERADRLAKEAEDGTKSRLAEAALAKLGAKKPGRDVKHVDLENIEDEASAERAAKKLLKSDPDLFAKKVTRQKRGAGGRDEDDDDNTDTDDKKPKRPVNRLRAGLAAGK